jgi:hypothetical protein
LGSLGKMLVLVSDVVIYLSRRGSKQVRILWKWKSVDVKDLMITHLRFARNSELELRNAIAKIMSEMT